MRTEERVVDLIYGEIFIDRLMDYQRGYTNWKIYNHYIPIFEKMFDSIELKAKNH